MNIWIAAADNNVEKVEAFLASSEFTPNSKDQNGYTPMHAAAEYGHLDLLKLLAEKGGDVNIKDNDGDTPLHACEQVTAAKWLVSFGADLGAKNKDGLTPLEKAEEDDDFPELVAYFRAESGMEDPDKLPDNVKLTMQAPTEEEDAPQVTEEQRARLASIVEHGTDADFEEYLKTVLGPGEEESAKKKKTEES